MNAISFAPAGLRNHLRLPAVRSGYALIISSLITSMLGGLYWFVAARHYPAAALGVGSSLVAATTLLAGVANLGFKNGLIRFVPTAGRGTGGLIVRSYSLTAASATVAGGIFLAGINRWAPQLGFLRSSAITIALFISTLIAWSIFVLQDSVLVGMGRAAWVPVENTVFSLLKIGALLALVSAASRWGVFLSWSAPTVVLVVVVNIAMISRLLPKHRSNQVAAANALSFRDVLRFSLADHVATLLWMATIDGLPLVVLATLGSANAAYYYLAAQIAYGLYVMSGCIGAALVAESSRHPLGFADLTDRAMRQAFRLVLPAAGAVVIAAPFLLRIFGAEYERNATPLLRLLALSAIPYTATSIILSGARVRNAMRTVIAGHAAIFIMCMGLSVALQGRYGLAGVGAGMVFGQSAVAVTLLALSARRDYGTADSFIAAFGSDLLGAVRRAKATLGLAERVRSLGLPLDGQANVTLLAATNAVTVATLRGYAGHDTVVVKLARGRKATRSLGRHIRSLQAVSSDPRLAPLVPTFPRILDEGTGNGERFVVESLVPDVAPSAANASPGHGAISYRAVASFMVRIHRPTAHRAVVDEALFDTWVNEPMRLLQVASGLGRSRHRATAELLEAELRTALLSQRLVVVRTHGDLTPGNLLLDEEGTEVAGVVDWDCSSPNGLPGVDAAMFVLAARRELSGKEFGEIVVDLANGGELDANESALFESAAIGRRSPSIRHLVLLAWLAHVSSNLSKCERYGRSPRWMRRNVAAVFDGLGFDATTLAAPRSINVVDLRTRAAKIRDGVEAVLTGPRSALVAIAVASSMWFFAMTRTKPSAMTDLGLVSVVPLFAWLPLGVVVALFVRAVTRKVLDEKRLGILLAGFIVMIHGATPVAYGTLRYSWAWKHIGIVDYINRNGSVKPSIGSLDVYHNWPGFFSANAALVNLVGVKNAVVLALWSPVAVNLLAMAALLALLPSLVPDRRVVWTAMWLFFLSNWVGQDYFSPQAMAYVLYLVIMAMVLAFFRRDSRDRALRPVTVLGALALMITVISSHQVSPAMMLGVLACLSATRRFRTVWLWVAALVAQVLWLAGPARVFTGKQARSILESFGAPLRNTETSLQLARPSGIQQQLVTLSGRTIVVFLGLLAIIGVVRRFRRGHRDATGVFLMVSPMSLIAANEFGGEILFRAFLFSVPFLALYGASALLPRKAMAPSRVQVGALACTSVMLLSCFVLAYFGKDRQEHFTKDEIAATDFLVSNAVEPTLLVEGSANYPSRFLDYERFVYVPIALEAPQDVATIVQNPAERLAPWLSDPRYARAFLIITRSQKADIATSGILPADTLDRIESGLRASPRFSVVFENHDAVIFAPATAGGRS